MAAEAAEQQKTAVHMLETYEAELGEAESQLLELNSYSEKLTQEYNEKVELQEVLIKSQSFFEMDIPFRVVDEPNYNPLSGAAASSETGAGSAPLLDDGFAGRDDDVRFSFATGVIPLEDKARFERALFRNTRGNCYVRFAEIEQPVTDPVKGTLVQKLVFIIFYQSASIERKIKRICDAFGARRYAIPDPAGGNGQAINAAMKANLTDLSEARKVLIKNRDLRRILCEDLATKVENWLRVVVREKAVYHTLNLYKADVHGMLRGEGWIVADQLETVKNLVSASHATFDVAGSSLIEPVPKPWPTPPTSFALNDFTYPYQVSPWWRA
jgi:V-type H+-transporting ATPase subunit a